MSLGLSLQPILRNFTQLRKSTCATFLEQTCAINDCVSPIEQRLWCKLSSLAQRLWRNLCHKRCQVNLRSCEKFSCVKFCEIGCWPTTDTVIGYNCQNGPQITLSLKLFHSSTSSLHDFLSLLRTLPARRLLFTPWTVLTATSSSPLHITAAGSPIRACASAPGSYKESFEPFGNAQTSNHFCL